MPDLKALVNAVIEGARYWLYDVHYAYAYVTSCSCYLFLSSIPSRIVVSKVNLCMFGTSLTIKLKALTEPRRYVYLIKNISNEQEPTWNKHNKYTRTCVEHEYRSEKSCT